MIAMDTVDQVQGVSLPALRHVHLIVQCRTYKPLVNAASAKSWITELAQLVGMKLLIQPQAVYSNTPGNRGLTAIAAISTSHITLHFWDEPQPAELQLDIYSCKEFKKDIIFRDLTERFAPTSIKFKILDRNHDLTDWNASSPL